MGWVREGDQQTRKAALAAKLLEAAVYMGIGTVAEGVETRGELNWLRDHGADVVQGFPIGRPDSDLVASGPDL